MRIILTVPSLDRSFGGPIAKARDLARALTELGHDVALTGAGEGPNGVGLGQLGRFHATPIPSRIGPLLDAVRHADVVHVLGLRDPVGTIAAWEARRRTATLILEPVGMFRRLHRSMILKSLFDETLGRVVIGTAARLIASSRMEAMEFVAEGIDRSRICIRPNGVWFDELLPLPPRGPLRKEFGIPASAPLILTLARINGLKGLLVLATAMALLPDAWALVAGPDEGDGTLPELQSLRTSLGLGDRLVIVPEGLWGDRKRSALAEADCFCLPSFHESFGTAAIEAAGVGIPVVTTTECGVAEWLDPRASRIIAPGQAKALAEALGDILRGSSHREFSANAAVSIREELQWSRLAEKQVQIYEQAR